jgi:shikimate kinase
VANIYLVGFMGAGKSAVGAALAERLGRTFVDLDRALEEREGMTVREIFERRGEAAFRAAEAAELGRVAASEDLVVATGGGAFASAANRELIRASGGVSVFLDVPWPVIRERLGPADPERPKWTGDARALYLARRADYLRADLRLGLEGHETPAEIAAAAAGALSELPCAC